ncbi:B12-binding domain-containing radical SAM protein [Candidatus Nitronereus thalassa]|uniref:Radical SAM protein n=1 Tax=Candidatus Nitronereus thalassa TaxID=3020898 RepID=A0ABU3K5L5_9BACT|nr:radical SAM protein [Candidatus Nitronereus thalassa]MDT7041671.1 radical SAM protein [Candidatus Nitronereus thalassa]
MNKIKVGLMQINNSFSGQNYFPLSAGMLQAYAQANLGNPERFEFRLPIYKRIAVKEAVDQLLGVDVLFVSTYVWNMRISLEIAKRLKEQNSEMLIVFGGPQVPERDNTFLKQHPFIDITCHGEGEHSALEILEKFECQDWPNIPSISFIDRNGAVVTNPKGGRMKELAQFPSPYLEGIFEPLMQANPNEHWIALWETNRGCPFACTFCDWGSAVASKVYKFDIERLYKEVEWFATHKIEFVFCCDANFGILSRDIDIAKFVAHSKMEYGYPHALSVQATKNATERAYETQKILADAGLNKGVDIALQSMDPNTLKSIKRGNISTNTYQELQKRFTKDNVETYTDLILGLPGETYETFTKAVSTIIENGQHNRIQFNNLSILPNAEMGDPEYQEKYGMQWVESKTINIHGSVFESEDDIFEMQQLVIATESMPKKDWVRTRVFSWMTAFLYFDKVFQVPLVLIHNLCEVPHRELIEIFLERDLEGFPILQGIKSYFIEKAIDIQNAGPEYCHSDKWLNIWWPADEYILIELCFEGKVEKFFKEAQQLIEEVLKGNHLRLPNHLLQDAVELNCNLLKQPFQSKDLEIECSYNIWEYYRAAITGEECSLINKSTTYHIDRTTQVWDSWDDWCREVIWYGNKKGAYLYGNNVVDVQLSGHF